MRDASTALIRAVPMRRLAHCLPAQMIMTFFVGEHMKALSTLSMAFCFAFLLTIASCGKEAETKGTARTAEDTMLMHDLAEANKNTAAAAAVDNSLNTVKSSGDPSNSAGATAQSPSDTRAVTPTPAGSQAQTSGVRLTPPLRAADASGRTTVPTSRSPASGDPCDSRAPVDQRSCLNRSIVANDADLNRTYQDLLAQARKSGGSDLEDRFRQGQREWINQRDADCRAQTAIEDGKLWARARARCLADYSAKRTSELQRNLSSLRGQ